VSSVLLPGQRRRQRVCQRRRRRLRLTLVLRGGSTVAAPGRGAPRRRRVLLQLLQPRAIACTQHHNGMWCCEAGIPTSDSQQCNVHQCGMRQEAAAGSIGNRVITYTIKCVLNVFCTWHGDGVGAGRHTVGVGAGDAAVGAAAQVRAPWQRHARRDACNMA